MFGIQVGVGNHISRSPRLARWASESSSTRIPEDSAKGEETELAGQERVADQCRSGRHSRLIRVMTWLVPEHDDHFSQFLPVGTRAAKSADSRETAVIFKMYSLELQPIEMMCLFISTKISSGRSAIRSICRQTTNAEVDRYARAGVVLNLDELLRCDKIKWSEALKLNVKRHKYAIFDEKEISVALYRAFCKKYLFYDSVLNEKIRLFPFIFPTPESRRENRLIVATDIGYRSPLYNAIMTDCIAECPTFCASSRRPPMLPLLHLR